MFCVCIACGMAKKMPIGAESSKYSKIKPSNVKCQMSNVNSFAPNNRDIWHRQP